MDVSSWVPHPDPRPQVRMECAEKKEVVISDCPVQAVVVYPDRAEVGS